MKTITVKGVGSASVKPDLIVVSMRMETKDKDYEKTMEYAAERINLINDALEEVGFEKSAVKTTSFDVDTDYESVKDKDGNYKSVFRGYVCKHDLKVEFDMDTKKLAKALAAISSSYAFPKLSVSFTVKDPNAVKKEVLKSAAINAREKADILCTASGAKLGDLISIDYNWGEISVYSESRYDMVCCDRVIGSAPDFDIEPDDIDAHDSATFVWEIA